MVLLSVVAWLAQSNLVLGVKVNVMKEYPDCTICSRHLLQKYCLETERHSDSKLKLKNTNVGDFL